MRIFPIDTPYTPLSHRFLPRPRTRFVVIALLAVFVLVALAGSYSTPPAPIKNATIFHGDALATSVDHRTQPPRASDVVLQGTSTQLKGLWAYNAKAPITVQPTIADDRIFWGSWDGFEHATTLAGKELWKTYLGRTVDLNCNPAVAGVASTAAVADVSIRGAQTDVVFVGGGDAQLYALDARSGVILWTRRLGPSPATFLWSSPVVHNGMVYMGTASFGDCPLTQGQLFQIDPATGDVEHVFNSVPNGCVGGGIWTSLTFDDDDDAIYFATGTLSPCLAYSEAMVRVRASDLKLQSYWRVPPNQQVSDGDFGAAPTLFTAHAGFTTRQMVGVVNKNGLFYAFNRDDIDDGPAWTTRIADGGVCPQCGDGSIAGAGWDGNRLFVAGGTTRIDGRVCKGGLRALDPLNGAFIWQRCLMDGPALGAVVTSYGMVAVAEGTRVLILGGVNGALLYSATSPRPDGFWSPPQIADGVLYQGSMGGYLLAWKIAARETISA